MKLALIIIAWALLISHRGFSVINRSIATGDRQPMATVQAQAAGVEIVGHIGGPGLSVLVRGEALVGKPSAGQWAMKRSKRMEEQAETTHKRQSLTGQVALITGGGRGLGRAYALALAQVGMAVAVTARTTAEIQATAQQIEQTGGRALAIPADVTDAKAIAQLVATVERQLGPIDLLVNNAGIARAFALIAEVGEEEWWRELEVNLRGPFLCARALLPSMIARKRGRIINIASRGGLIVFERASAYCVSKAALIRLSQFLAAETKEHGLAVFAIHPGTVRTPMNDYTQTADIVRQRAPLIQQIFQKHEEEGTYASIERSVDLVLLLASGRADVLSGRFLSIEDDVNALIRRSVEIEQDDLYTLQLHKLAINQAEGKR